MIERLPTQQSYDPAYFAFLAEVEDTHFWFRARNQVIAMLLERLSAQLPQRPRVLEVGCGTGNTLRVLERICRPATVVGMDLFREGLHFARQRSAAHLVQASLHHLPFGTPVDLIGAFDVLEHYADDGQALRGLNAILAESGWLLLTVPAFPSLWSYADVVARHQRRYTRVELRQKLQAAGFQVERLTYFMATIFPLAWLIRRWLVLGKPGYAEPQRAEAMMRRELKIIPLLNGIFAALLRWESWALRSNWNLPIGVSLAAIARKVTTDEADGDFKLSE